MGTTGLAWLGVWVACAHRLVLAILLVLHDEVQADDALVFFLVPHGALLPLHHQFLETCFPVDKALRRWCAVLALQGVEVLDKLAGSVVVPGHEAHVDNGAVRDQVAVRRVDLNLRARALDAPTDARLPALRWWGYDRCRSTRRRPAGIKRKERGVSGT